MTHQFDMVPLDAAALERIGEQLPKAREVTEPRFPNVQINISGAITAEQGMQLAERALRQMQNERRREKGEQQERAIEAASRADVGFGLVLRERAREDHR